MRAPWEKPTLKKAESPISETNAPEKTQNEKFRERKIINGTEISVVWDKQNGWYEMYFPQIDTEDERAKKYFLSGTTVLTQSTEVAKQIFEYAEKIAQTETDVYEICRKVEEYSKTMPADDEGGHHYGYKPKE